MTPEDGSLFLKAQAALTSETDISRMFWQWLNDLPVLIWMLNSDHQPVYYNTQWTIFTGKPVESLIVEGGWLENLHPDDYDKVVTSYFHTATLRQPYYIDYRYRHVDGEYRWLTSKGIPMMDPDGNFKGYLGTCTDTTSFHVVQDELSHQKDLLNQIIDNIPSSIWWKDREFRFMGGNSRLVSVTGLPSVNELIGKTDYDLPWKKEESDFFRKIDRQVQETGVPMLNVEESITLEDGTQSTLLTSKVPLRDPQGNIFGTLGIFTDITQRKQMEDDLRRLNDQLASSNKSLEHFAYVASHDLQEPLRKIRAFGERLSESAEGRLTDTEQDYLARMMNASIRMNELIQDLLMYSRIAVDKKPIDPIDLNEVIAKVTNDLEVAIQESGAVIDCRGLPMLYVHETHLRQLFTNLMGNAIKFRHATEPPVIQISAIPLPRQSRHVDWCQLMIKDNGIGFDEQYAEKIFGMFQRLHGRNQYPGTGVGLAICQKIAEVYGGHIKAFSRPGEGACFTVTLPCMFTEERYSTTIE